MSLDKNTGNLSFNTTVTTRSKNLSATNYSDKTISKRQPQQSDSDNCQLSNLVIINLRNHDHGYNKKRENHDDHNQLTGTNSRRATLPEPCQKNITTKDTQKDQGQKRKRTNHNDVKETVIYEQKRKNTSNHQNGENDSAKSSKPQSSGSDDTNGNAQRRFDSDTFKYSRGQKVLVYEPDSTKAKVLYDAKVVDCIIPLRDKRKRIQYTVNGKKTSASITRRPTDRDFNSNKPEYLIHFSGWSSSWDRLVTEDTILCDTEANRNIQIELAKKAAEHLRKNKIKLNKIPAIIKEQVLAQSDNQLQATNMNIDANSLHCLYRDPKIYLDQALKHRHDHSYAEDPTYLETNNSIQKTNTDQIASSLDSDTTSQSSNGSINVNRRLNSNATNTSSKSVSENSRRSESQFTYFTLPNQFIKYLENDKKQIEDKFSNGISSLKSQLREYSNIDTEVAVAHKSGNCKTIPPNTSLSVRKLIDNACLHMSQNIRLDSDQLDPNTQQLLTGNFDGLLKEFQYSLKIYFDILADGDYLYYNNVEKQQYSPRSNLHIINPNQATVKSNQGGNNQDKISVSSNSLTSSCTSDNIREQSLRPINILNVSHLIRFIVLLPEFLNATPDLTWRHQQIISFFLNQLNKYLTENVLQEQAVINGDTSKKKLQQVSGKTRNNSVKRLSESLKDRLLAAT